MLEKIKELRIKAESAKVLFYLADDETEKKHFSKLLDRYKQELLKFLISHSQNRAETSHKSQRN